MARSHHYRVQVDWTGNRGTGTSAYDAYSRDHRITAPGKPELLGSSDPAFLGDPTRHNPEDLLVSTLSSCHMLWYLHLCVEAGIVVTGYVDQAHGVMEEAGANGGRFTEVTLAPQVRLADPSRAAEAMALHERAHDLCFIANSVNFPVRIQPAPC